MIATKGKTRTKRQPQEHGYTNDYRIMVEAGDGLRYLDDNTYTREQAVSVLLNCAADACIVNVGKPVTYVVSEGSEFDAILKSVEHRPLRIVRPSKSEFDEALLRKQVHARLRRT